MSPCFSHKHFDKPRRPWVTIPCVWLMSLAVLLFWLIRACIYLVVGIIIDAVMASYDGCVAWWKDHNQRMENALNGKPDPESGECDEGG